MGIIDSLISVIIALVLVYVGVAILWAINPILAILFVLLAAYIFVRGVRSGKLEL